jgi:hypothetical protein
VHVILTFVLQFTLILMTFHELATNCNYTQVIIGPVPLFIMFARFICATILHLSCVDEVHAGLTMMKFSVNHEYRFCNPGFAFMSGFLQYISCLNVELANIGVICGANDTIDIVFNFIALAIIAEFDNYVYGSMKNESFKALTDKEFCKQVLVISHTTSKKCRPDELSKVYDEQLGEFRPLKIQFADRRTGNKWMYVTYKVFRTFYISVFFYFLPFSVVVLSTLIPLLARYFFENEMPECLTNNN